MKNYGKFECFARNINEIENCAKCFTTLYHTPQIDLNREITRQKRAYLDVMEQHARELLETIDRCRKQTTTDLEEATRWQYETAILRAGGVLGFSYGQMVELKEKNMPAMLEKHGYMYPEKAARFLFLNEEPKQEPIRMYQKPDEEQIKAAFAKLEAARATA